MYKNDIKRGDSYRFGEYAMAPEYDNPFVKKEIESLLERMGAESIEDLMFTAEGDMGANSSLYLQPEGEQSSSVTRVFVKTGEEWRNVPPLDFPVLHAVGYYMYVNIDTESYTGKISEVQLNAGPSTSIRNVNQGVVITKEAFDIITQEAQITIVGNSVATISSVIITQGTNTTPWPESGWKEIDGADATVTVTGTDLNADNLQLLNENDVVISWSTITDTNATGFVTDTIEFKLMLNGEQYGGQVSFSGQ